MNVRRIYLRLFYSRSKFAWTILLGFICTIFLYFESDIVQNQQRFTNLRTNLNFDFGAKSEFADGTCRIPTIDPFDQSIAKYIDHPKSVDCRRIQSDLVHLDEDGILRLNRTEIDKYSAISCYYRYFDRGQSDRDVKYEDRRSLNKDTRLKKPFVKVVCREGPDRTRIFQSYFAHPLPLRDESKSNQQLSQNSNDDFNVFIFAIDSLSRSMAYRHLPKTVQYLKDTGLVVFEKFLKVGENTKPNLAAVLTGMRARTEQRDMPSELSENSSHYDHWPFVWKEFKRRKGYETIYMEDYPHAETFHYASDGFRKKPSDHYYFTYWHTQQEGANELPAEPSQFCSGNRPQHETLLEILRKHLHQSKASDRRQFMFSIANELSHDFSSDIERADEDFAKFFQQLDSDGALDRTILFVLGDHGPRFTEPRKTVVGFLEERLPFLGIRLPPILNLKFPRLRETLKLNARQRLCSMFDLHETFMDILNQTFDGKLLEDQSIRGRSLFRPIPVDRRCFDAGVPDRYCLCSGIKVMPVNHRLARAAADVVLAEANRQIRKFKDRCAQWNFEKILYFIRIPWPGEDSDKSETYFVAFRVSPLKAIFEGVAVRNLEDQTIRYKPGTLERINSFGIYGNCLTEAKLVNTKKYCACKKYV